jgi:hypothetical protein
MTEWSGRFFLFGLLGILCIPVSVPAAELSFKSDTLLRVFERDTKTEEDAAVVPIYEYLQVDYDTPDEPGLAFHIYGWGRWDMADNDYFEDTTAGELLYGYLEYSGKQARFNAKLGRQQVFEGVANEAVDGLRLSSDLGKYFSGSVYAGQPVGLDSTQGRGGDSIYGGRLAHHLNGLYDLGLSYKLVRNDSTDAEEMTGVDLAAFLPYGINVHGFSVYNLENDGWGEHSYELNFALGPVSVRPYFQKFKYEDYFGTGANSANPFRFLANTNEELKIGGADLTLPVGPLVLVAKAKNYDYKVLDDTSQYFAGQATWLGGNHSQVGAEFGYMNGNEAQNEYYLVRLFTFWDQMPGNCPVGFVSGDLVYVGYDQDIYGEDSSLFISLGAGRKFLEEALELKLSGDYSQDPYFDEDLRALLKASYHFGKEL